MILEDRVLIVNMVYDEVRRRTHLQEIAAIRASVMAPSVALYPVKPPPPPPDHAQPHA